MVMRSVPVRGPAMSFVRDAHALLLALSASDRKLALSDTKEAAKYVVSRRMQVRPSLPFHLRFLCIPLILNPSSNPPGRPSSGFFPRLVR